MTKSDIPKRLWCHCLELEDIIRLHTALDIYNIDGKVHENGPMATNHGNLQKHRYLL